MTPQEHIERAEALQAKAHTLRPGAPAGQTALLDALVHLGLAQAKSAPKPAPKKAAPKKASE